MKIKICPACNAENDMNARTCSKCRKDLRSVRPKEAGFVKQPEPQVKEEPPISSMSPRTLTNDDILKQVRLISIDNMYSCDLVDGEVIFGRENTGARYFGAKGYVGRTHARITKMGEMLVIEDLKSTNGTYVNGQRIKPDEKMPLKAEDMIGLGGNQISQENAAFLRVVITNI